ncbi:MAG: hypothetical protein GC150_01225 [Rhizobiales bacterium]|nr:hypothetical protein [Hyphomicrobiales bacterium]
MLSLRRIVGIAAAMLAALTAPTLANAKERHAIIIANKDYTHAAGVDFAMRDADAIETMVTGALGVPARNVIRINNATLGDMRALFGSQSAAGRVQNIVTQPDAEVFVYFAGHGSKETVGGGGDAKPFLMAVDSRPDNLVHTGFSLDDMIEQLKRLRDQKLPEGRVTLVLESCFSGRSQAGDLLTNRSAPIHGAPVIVTKRAPVADDGFLILAAAQGDEFAVWDTEYKQSVFTDALVLGMFGEADDSRFGGNADGSVTLGEIESFVANRVATRLQALQPGVRQVPDIAGGTAGDILVETASVVSMPPQVITRQHREKLQSGSLLARLDIDGIQDYLRTCIYCPRGDELRAAVRDNQRKAQVCALEAATVERLLENGTVAEIEVFNQDCECCARKAELLSRVASLRGETVTDTGNAGAGAVNAGTAAADQAGSTGAAPAATGTPATPGAAVARADAAAEEAEAIVEPENLALALQEELKRVGCLNGAVDGIWGNQSRGALQRFAKEVEGRFDTDEPSLEAYALASEIEDQVCEAPSRTVNQPRRTTTRRETTAAPKKVTPRTTTRRASTTQEATPRKRTTRTTTTRTAPKKTTTRTATRTAPKKTTTTSGGSATIGIGGIRIGIGGGSSSSGSSNPGLNRQCNRYGNFC